MSWDGSLSNVVDCISLGNLYWMAPPKKCVQHDSWRYCNWNWLSDKTELVLYCSLWAYMWSCCRLVFSSFSVNRHYRCHPCKMLKSSNALCISLKGDTFWHMFTFKDNFLTKSHNLCRVQSQFVYINQIVGFCINHVSKYAILFVYPKQQFDLVWLRIADQ